MKDIKKTWKKMCALLLCASMCSSLAACGKKNGNSTVDESGEIEAAVKKVLEDKEDVTISFWASATQQNFTYLEDTVNDFMEEYPNIKVEITNQGPITDLMDKLTQNIVSKTTPTLSNVTPTYFLEYIDSGAVIDLMPYYDNDTVGYTDEEKADFYQTYIDEAMSFGEEGTMYGFPTHCKTADILIYNKTYFDAKGWNAPTSWDEVAEYSKQIKEDTGMPGFSYDVTYPEKAFRMLSQQWGSSYIKEDGTADIDNDASREAMQFYKENYDAGYFTMPSEMPSAGGNYSNVGFAAQECYMYVGGAAGVPYAVPKEESGQEMFELGMAPIPQKDSENQVAISEGADYCVFSNSTAEERVAAWLLIKFFSRDDQNIEWLKATGYLPITSTMLDEPEYKAFLEMENDGSADYYKAAAVNAVLEMTDYLSYEHISPLTSTLATECGTMWKSVIIGGADVDSALSETAAKVE